MKIRKKRKVTHPTITNIYSKGHHACIHLHCKLHAEGNSTDSSHVQTLTAKVFNLHWAQELYWRIECMYMYIVRVQVIGENEMQACMCSCTCVYTYTHDIIKFRLNSWEVTH